MRIQRDLAVVLRQLDYSETSQILVFFTQNHGKLRAIGKGLKRGTKKRFAVGIDLLDIGHIVVSIGQERAGLATLTEWKQTRSLVGLRDSLARLHAAEYLAEVTDAVTEDWDSHTELFDALLASLFKICDVHEPLGCVVAYQFTLLDAIGLLPRFDSCIPCGRDGDLTHFSSHLGGMICRHCESPQVEKWETAKTTLQALRRNSPDQATVGSFGVLNYHLSHLIGREPRLASKLVDAVRRRQVT